MEDVLKKVSQYQLFNYLLSGAIFVAALNKTTDIHLSGSDAIVSFFIYYFIGMVISRIGSLIVEPTLKLLGIVKFKTHNEYVQAAVVDPKLDTLSQENNTYRTLIATFIMYMGAYLCAKHFNTWPHLHPTVSLMIGALLLIVLFVFAYHKQTKYITSRIETALKGKK